MILNKKKIFSILIFIVLILSIIIFKKKNENDENYLVYNIYAKPNTIDPHQFRDMLEVQLMNTVYEGLLRLDENGNYELAVASSFYEKDNELVFEIRDNAKFSDGTSISADDVVNGFVRALDKKTAARHAEMLFPIKNAREFNKGEVSSDKLGVKNIDGKVHITLEKYTPYFKYILTLPISYPIKKEYVNDISDYTKAIYNGPYIIEKMDDENIYLTKNKYYWNEKNVEIEKVKYISMSDYSVIENLIKNAEVDLTSIDPFDFETKKKNNELLSYQNGRLWYLQFNFENPILNNLENRLAIMKAIDRSNYVKDVRLDGSIEAKSVVSGILGDYRAKYDDKNFFIDNVKTDILKGKRLRLLTSNSTSELKEANYLQEVFRKQLGLNVDVLTVSYKDRLALTRSGDFDIVLNTYGPKFDDPLTMLLRFTNKNNDVYNAYDKKEYNKLIELIENEKDHNKRNEYIYRAEKFLVDNAVIAPLYFSIENWYIRNKYTNIIVHPISNTMDIHKIKYNKKSLVK